jgi:hypothetical protein
MKGKVNRAEAHQSEGGFYRAIALRRRIGYGAIPL